MKRPLLALLLITALGAASLRAEVNYKAAIVVEPSTWTVLYSKDAHTSLPTASMIKMLNALVVMDAIAHGEVTWDTPVRVSREVERVGGSKVYLKEGEVFSIRDLMTAMLVKSANDAAAALAEGVSGSFEAHARRMDEKARSLGLHETAVFTPNGLPTSDTHLPEDRSSPSDLAHIGAEVLKHPELRLLVSTRETTFRNGELQLFSPNRLLGRYPYATGIKTGYHEGADFCVTASARRDGMELIAVVMGAPHRADRFDSAQALLEEAFAHYRLLVPVHAGELLEQQLPVSGGAAPTVAVRAAREARLVVSRDQRGDVRRETSLAREAAPLRAGSAVGRLVLRLGSKTIAEVPVVAAADVPARAVAFHSVAQGFWSSLLNRLASLVIAL